MIQFVRRWLSQPVLEDAGVDRPFKLRRVSALLMAGGWAIFLVSCLAGLWLARHNIPLATWADIVEGRVADVSSLPSLQWLRVASQGMGAALFIGGMLSVSLFDRRDRIPVWKAD